LPAAYIIEQVIAFRNGERRSASPDQPNTAEMIKAAKAVTPEALRQAADYFARLPRSRWVRVIEGATAPRTFPDRYGWRNAVPGGGTEPIGDRIIELSDDLPRMMIGDDHVMLTDYAPPGAIARGRRVSETGGAGGIPCQSCHGANLNGGGAAPRIAGRPAGYIARTLWDIRVGARHNAGVAPMRNVAMGLASSEIRDVSAYLASRRYQL
jgi:cytochrome c553